ncbi:succinate-semialdehyde dehydrogenase [Oceanisphaera marina]|uniref:Succinate-semialdehyde dehydrogenase n=1 Tax=Oceanisphaera marina TaxID=2017550 RepID=A0ABQ1ICJ4_9GAMM|nr:aldehyde dehydrogenase family protein [Oceanisphaera marina]GGB34871.1 succinate-semialdehyde dehydrogenase [Oceanisphaera marina]
MEFISYHPATGTEVTRLQALSANELEQRLQQNQQAAQTWRQSSTSDRSALLNRLASLLSANRERLALCITREMGKLLSEALAEVDRCALECNYFATHGPAMLPLARSMNTCEPMGSVLLLSSWRFPLWQVFRVLAPTLMAGNAVLLKLAENLPLCAREIETLLADAEAPKGLVFSLLISKPQVATLIADARVKALAFSGNRQDASQVAALAGQQLKPIILELDETELQIILDDADLDLAVAAALRSRFRNAGQLGHAARGFMVTPGIAEQFVARLSAQLAEWQPGDPSLYVSTLGPLATRLQRDDLQQQVQAALADGAQAVVGCQLPTGAGWYYPASLLDRVRPDMAVFRRQLSGPLACVLRAPNQDAILDMCQDLGPDGTVSIWTRDMTQGEQLARQLPFATCLVNREPCQGSGYQSRPGLMTDGHFSIRAFCHIKRLLVSA